MAIIKDVRDLYYKLKDPELAGENNSFSAKIFNLKSGSDPYTVIEINALDTAFSCFAAQQAPGFGPAVCGMFIFLSLLDTFGRINEIFGVNVGETRIKSFLRMLLCYFAGNLTGNMKIFVRTVLIAVVGSYLPFPVRAISALSIAAAAYSTVSVAGKIYVRSINRLVEKNVKITDKALRDTGKEIAADLNIDSEFKQSFESFKARVKESDLAEACKSRIEALRRKFTAKETA